MDKEGIVNSIKKSCEDIIAYLERHHDILTDNNVEDLWFEAAIQDLQHMSGEINKDINGLKGFKYVLYEQNRLKAETKKPLSDEDILRKDTIFYKKKVVFTGILEKFPDRDEIASILRQYGADVNGSISKKTDIVIKGAGAGPSKMKKIQELQEQGCSIRVIEEPEFIEILQREGIK